MTETATGTRVLPVTVDESQSSLSDGELLAKFVTHRDERSFSTLVQRHGPMVFSVCSRVSRDTHLAEDATQATFLVLARRARDVWAGKSLRGWLYGIAVKTAKEACRLATRRQIRETVVSELPDVACPQNDATDEKSLKVLLEEVGNLPEHLRAAVVLFELDGLSRCEVAEQLHIPQGTLSSRLGKARRILADRLRRRGVTLSAVGLATLFASRAAVGQVCSPVILQAIVSMWKSGCIPAAVSQLVKGVCTMLIVKSAMLVTVSVMLLALGLFVASGFSQERTDTPTPDHQGHAVPQAGALYVGEKHESPNRIFFTTADRLVSVNPDGSDERTLRIPDLASAWAVPSPDGQTIAYVEDFTHEKGNCNLCVSVIGDPFRVRRVQLPPKVGYIEFHWAPEGDAIHVSTGTAGTKGVQHHLLDVKRERLASLNILSTRTVDGWSTDGKSLITTEVGGEEEWRPKSIHLTDLQGKEQQVLAEPVEWVAYGQLSPDGKQLLVGYEKGLGLVSVDQPKTLIRVAGSPEFIERGEYGWAPDGKRIVFRRQKGKPEDEGDVEIVVSNPDGTAPTVIRKSNQNGIWKVYWR